MADGQTVSKEMVELGDDRGVERRGGERRGDEEEDKRKHHKNNTR